MESLTKYKIAVLGNTQLSLGFRLAGVAETYNAKPGIESERVLHELLQREDIGLVITTSSIVNGIKDRRLAESVSDSVLPMIIEVPDYKEEGEPDTLRKLILRALGIDISKTV